MLSAIKKSVNRIFASRNFDTKRSYRLIKAAVAVWFVAWSLVAFSAILGNPEYNWFGECPGKRGFFDSPNSFYVCLSTKDRVRNYLIISAIPLVLFLGLRFGAPPAFDYFFPKRIRNNNMKHR